VVGVVGELRYRDLLTPPPTLYLPLLQTDHQPRWLLVRTGSEATVSRMAAQAAATEVAPASLVLSVTPVAQLLAEPLARPRFLGSLVPVLAGLALALAGVGLYGVMSSIVASRTREMGIRISLGASHGRVRRLVMRQAIAIGAAGATLGLALAGLTPGWLRSLLYGVSPFDAVTLILAVLAILVITAAASYLPARRATRVDPMTALRAE
jgi:ABC-type antimicrobial peptide transport system permease subunit